MQTQAEAAAAAYRRLAAVKGEVECWCGNVPASKITGRVPGLKLVHRRDMPPDEVWFIAPNNEWFMGGYSLLAKYRIPQ